MLQATASSLAPYDAVLLLSFGGPEGPDDVLPFLRNVTRGRGIPDERLAAVAEHYHHFGGRSPINDQNRALLAALRGELAARGLDVPVGWGNRNWAPFATDALRELHDGGARRVLAVVTSAYGSYSGCRQYREDVARSVAALAAEGRALRVDKVRAYYNTPGFARANAATILDAYGALGATGSPAPLVLVTHSIPTTMEDASGRRAASYRAQHLDLAAVLAEEVGRALGATPAWQLAYCSRSGPPTQPWLEPDVNDVLRDLRAAGAPGVVLAPIGFVSDHMEVVYDLDTEARETADGLGLPMARAATAGTHPAFVASLVDLAVERAAAERGESPEQLAVGGIGPRHGFCPAGCCLRVDGEPSGVAAACGED